MTISAGPSCPAALGTALGRRPTVARGGVAQRVVLGLAGRIDCGVLTVVLPDGREHVFAGRLPGIHATLQIHDPRVFRRLLFGGALAFAEAYMDGDCDSPDLAALVQLVVANETVLLRSLEGRRWSRLARRIGHVLRPNTRRGARRNIARHYDLGNDFYALWLDPSMTYSSAIFDRPDESLEEAQENKYRRMAEMAGIEPHHRVLEIGTGWGGFCCWAAREIGCRIDTITISRAQHDHTARRLQAENLGDQVALRLQDYRDVQGRYDRIVSIEMLEAVGEKYWPRYFATLHDRLEPGGRAALQVITIDDALYESYRARVDFIQRYIFPGGLLPSRGRLSDQARRAGLSWDRCDAYGAHYAETLAHWRRAFDAAWPDIRALGFDERFRRMWRYYFSYCEAGFDTGRIDVIHAALSKS